MVTTASVGVRRSAAETGKVLRRRSDASVPPASHRGSHRFARDSRIRRERASRECGVRDARHVSHGCERDRDADGAQRSRGGCGVRAHAVGGELLGRSAHRRCPRQSSDRPTLLVDRDDRPPTLAPQYRGELAELSRPGDVAAEEDHTGRAPLAQGLAYVVRSRRSREAQDDELADLLLECALVARARRACCRVTVPNTENETEHEDGERRARGHRAEYGCEGPLDRLVDAVRDLAVVLGRVEGAQRGHD